MLQPTNHLCGPSSDLLQQVNIFVVRTQHSTPGLQVQNRCLIAPIRLPCLTMNFKEVCSPMDPVFTGSVISCQGCCFLLLLFVFSLLVCIVVCLFVLPWSLLWHLWNICMHLQCPEISSLQMLKISPQNPVLKIHFWGTITVRIKEKIGMYKVLNYPASTAVSTDHYALGRHHILA